MQILVPVFTVKVDFVKKLIELVVVILPVQVETTFASRVYEMPLFSPTAMAEFVASVHFMRLTIDATHLSCLPKKNAGVPVEVMAVPLRLISVGKVKVNTKLPMGASQLV